MDLIAIMPIVSIIIALFVAGVALWQGKINRDKLRFDLYNRRFDIYSRTLDFYQALMTFSPFTSKEPFNRLQKAFIKAYRESQFLFDEKSDIYNILDQMHSKSMIIIGFKEDGKKLADSAPQEFLNMQNQSMEALQWFTDAVSRLEKAMAHYLNFHKMTA